MTSQPFGHIARIRVQQWGPGELSPTFSDREIHRRGPASRVRTAAKRTRHFVETRSTEALTVSKRAEAKVDKLLAELCKPRLF